MHPIDLPARYCPRIRILSPASGDEANARLALLQRTYLLSDAAYLPSGSFLTDMGQDEKRLLSHTKSGDTTRGEQGFAARAGLYLLIADLTV